MAPLHQTSAFLEKTDSASIVAAPATMEASFSSSTMSNTNNNNNSNSASAAGAVGTANSENGNSQNNINNNQSPPQTPPLTAVSATPSSFSSSINMSPLPAATMQQQQSSSSLSAPIPTVDIPIQLRFVNANGGANGNSVVRAALLTLPQPQTLQANSTTTALPTTSLGQLRETIRQTFGLKAKDKLTMTLHRNRNTSYYHPHPHLTATTPLEVTALLQNEATNSGNNNNEGHNVRVDHLFQPHDLLEIRLVRKTTRIVKVMRKLTRKTTGGSTASPQADGSQHQHNSSHHSFNARHRSNSAPNAEAAHPHHHHHPTVTTTATTGVDSLFADHALPHHHLSNNTAVAVPEHQQQQQSPQQQQQQQHYYSPNQHHQISEKQDPDRDSNYKPVEQIVTTTPHHNNNNNYVTDTSVAAAASAVILEDKQEDDGYGKFDSGGDGNEAARARLPVTHAVLESNHPNRALFQQQQQLLSQNSSQKMPARPSGLQRTLSDTSSLTTPEETMLNSAGGVGTTSVAAAAATTNSSSSAGAAAAFQKQKQQQQQKDHVRTVSMRSLEDTHKLFYCPLMFCLMSDPVAADDGYTYERSSIQDHFASLVAAHNEDQEENEGNNHYNSATLGGMEVVLTSPLTRQVVSHKLIPNRTVEVMIVQAVESGALAIDGHDFDDWQERRKLKLALERSRADERASTASLPLILPDGSSGGRRDEDESISDVGDLANRRRFTSRAQTRQLEYPSNLLSRLVRLDRPTEDDRFGQYDSGLSVALPADPPSNDHNDSDNRTMDGNRRCAVSFCLTSLVDPQGQTNSISLRANDYSSFCPRCQRHVCRACNRVEVSDVLRGNRFKTTHTICVECVWQVTDVLSSSLSDLHVDDSLSSPYVAQTVRERLIRSHVAPRVAECAKAAFERERNFWHDKILLDLCGPLQDEIASMNSIKELDRLLSVKRQTFQKSLDNAKCQYMAVSNPDDHLKVLRERYSAICFTPTMLSDGGNVDLGLTLSFSNNEDAVDSRRLLEARCNNSSALPLALSYPTIGVRNQLRILREQLDTFVKEQRPLLELKAMKERMRLQKIRNDLEQRMGTVNKQCAAIDELSRYLDVLTSVVTEVTVGPSNVSSILIGDELFQSSSNSRFAEEDSNTATAATPPMQRFVMCPSCCAGPVLQAPATGCPNCHYLGGSEEWTHWDGQVGPHK